MIRILMLLCVLSFNSIAADEPNEVMLMGIFHFNNPGLDVIKTEVLDVTSAENQQYLKALSARIAAFKPASVMLEFDPKNTDKMNQKYQQYLNDQFELPINEMYQIGFRVAKLAGLKQVHSLDERSVQWQGEALFEYLKNKDPKNQAKMQKMIETVTKKMNNDQATMSLPELLAEHNNPTNDQLNKSFYLLTNAVGQDEFIGADAAASWWHRNFRMYARIQRQAQNGRVFALAGQGHTAIIKDLLADDSQFQAEDVNNYLFD